MSTYIGNNCIVSILGAAGWVPVGVFHNSRAHGIAIAGKSKGVIDLTVAVNQPIAKALYAEPVNQSRKFEQVKPRRKKNDFLKLCRGKNGKYGR